MDDLSQEVAVVTGASRGIGRATALRLVAAGAGVIAFSRSRDALDELVASNREHLHGVAGDVSKEDDVERLFQEAEARFGPCTMLVNNAGSVDPRPLVDTTREEWDETFAANVTGTFMAIRRAIPGMLSAGRGSIVNVASISGVSGPEKFPGFVSYCAAKAAVIMLTESLASELRNTPIRINAISPGSVDTAMWARVSGAAPADMTPEEIAESILYLLSERSRPINGQNLHVYGP